jgi:dGTP triphosphohydrolase
MASTVVYPHLGTLPGLKAQVRKTPIWSTGQHTCCVLHHYPPLKAEAPGLMACSAWAEAERMGIGGNHQYFNTNMYVHAHAQCMHTVLKTLQHAVVCTQPNGSQVAASAHRCISTLLECMVPLNSRTKQEQHNVAHVCTGQKQPNI